MIRAPWTDSQVAALNRFQREGRFHPFTCANRGDAAHERHAAEHGNSDHGLLVATPDGWVCPACDYRQDWAHAFMAESDA